MPAVNVVDAFVVLRELFAQGFQSLPSLREATDHQILIRANVDPATGNDTALDADVPVIGDHLDVLSGLYISADFYLISGVNGEVITGYDLPDIPGMALPCR